MLSRLDLQPALAYCTVTGRRRSRRYSDILSHNNLNLSSSQDYVATARVKAQADFLIHAATQAFKIDSIYLNKICHSS